jgi:hypothetical protein
MKTAVAIAVGWFNRVTLHDKQRPEPELVHAERRPATGLFASLTPDQRRRALSYNGPEGHGDSAFLIKAKA